MEEEINLMDVFKFILKKKMIIIIVGLLSVILAIIYTKFLLTPNYDATAKLILTNNELKTEADVYSYAKLPDRYFAVANSRTVLDKVIQNLKLEVEDVFEFKEKNISITHSPASFLITVTVETDNATKSVQIANEIVKVTIEEIKKIYNDENIQILDYAVENWEPTNINIVENIIKFIFVGEVFACGYILIIYIFIEPTKNKLKEKIDFEK